MQKYKNSYKHYYQQTEKLEEYTPVHKQIETEYAGLKDGSVTTASEFEFEGILSIFNHVYEHEKNSMKNKPKNKVATQNLEQTKTKICANETKKLSA